MANFNVTPNMNLPNPVPGVDPGPDYATNIQSSLNQIDQHNHSSGQGVLIQPNGLNISSDLPFNSNNAITLRTVRFVSQVSPIPNSAPDVGCLYVSGNELWYNDYTGGNQVQITTNGLINATSSGISSGTASATFSAGTLVVKSSSTSFANIDVQSVVLANAGNLVNQLTLLAPTLSSSYALTLPSVPLALSILTVDTSGNFGFTQSSASADPVGAAMSSSGANAVANSRTRSVGTTVGVGGVAISSSCGTFTNATASPTSVTNLSVTIETAGKPISIQLISDGSGSQSFFESLNTSGNSAVGIVRFLRNSSESFRFDSVASSTGTTTEIGTPVSSYSAVDPQLSGIYTYTVTIVKSGGDSVTMKNAKLVAYEL